MQPVSTPPPSSTPGGRPLTRNADLNAIIAAALQAADPAEAVRRHARRDGDTLWIDGHAFDLRRFDDVILIAVGKASAPMAAAAAERLGGGISQAVVVTKYGHAAEADRLRCLAPGRLELIESGHPVPDENSLRAGDVVCQALAGAGEGTLVVACISGGASALMVAPHPGISLGALRAVNDALLKCGADIREINTVRSRLDRLKGGGLARLAAPGTLVGLILSDVIGDPLEFIASGLTYDPRALNVLVANNTQACQAAAAAARARGYDARIVTVELSGEARDRGRQIARALLAAPPGACLIYGGEPTVSVRGGGKGGRNQELALAAALELDAAQPGGPPLGLVASLGTDGTDGPTDAAGAVALPDTVRRAAQMGLDAGDCLARNDSYTFFSALGDLILTGPTGTNVADVVIAMPLNH